MEDEEKMHKKNGNDLKNSKSLMRKGKEMNMKNDKVDRGRDMGLNREKRCREQSLHFSVRMVFLPRNKGGIFAKGIKTHPFSYGIFGF